MEEVQQKISFFIAYHTFCILRRNENKHYYFLIFCLLRNYIDEISGFMEF